MNKSTAFIITLLSILPIGSSIGQNSAIYDITFTSIWNANDHTSVPDGAHWSKLVGATHKTINTFLQIDSLASTGIKNIAETGNNTVFNSEVSAEISNGEADQYINGDNLGTATGNILISELTVTKDFPLLTLVSMIAPSPDWMVAINGYSLLDAEKNWKTSASIEMFAYDAGTDSGTDYSSGNVVSNPFQNISMISGAPFNGNKIGDLTITLKTTSTLNAHTFKQIKIYPNSVQEGKIYIRNLEGISLHMIEIYNCTGSLIKSFHSIENLNTMILDVQTLSTGVYILKLTGTKNQNLVQKFVVE